MPQNSTDSHEVRRTVRLTPHQDTLLLGIRAAVEKRLGRTVTLNEVFQLAVLCLADQEHCE